MNVPNKYTTAIKYLKNSLSLYALQNDAYEHEFTQAVDKSDRELVEKAWKAWQAYRDDLCTDLREALLLASEQKIAMPTVRKLSVTIDQQPELTKQFIFDALVELDGLMQQCEQHKPRNQSREQPLHEITIWVKKHGYKYKDNKEAVRVYVEIHGGNSDKLYSDLNNDLRKERERARKNP